MNKWKKIEILTKLMCEINKLPKDVLDKIEVEIDADKCCNPIYDFPLKNILKNIVEDMNFKAERINKNKHINR